MFREFVAEGAAEPADELEAVLGGPPGCLDEGGRATTSDEVQRADTIGVFQIESRAQIVTLPRMQPRCFYDVVVEVAVIQPGPTQGDLAHLYLCRRTGEEAVTYYDDRVVPILERKLGVPLFQEQMLQIAMVMAEFSGDEAEERGRR